MKKLKNKKLIARIVCVISLVCVMTAALVVPSLAWSYNESNGLFTSLTQRYPLYETYSGSSLTGYSTYTFNITSLLKKLHDDGYFDSGNDTMLNFNIRVVEGGYVIRNFPAISINLRQLYLAGQSISSNENHYITHICHYGQNVYQIKTSITLVPDPNSVLGAGYVIGMNIAQPGQIPVTDSWKSSFGDSPEVLMRLSPTADVYQELVASDYQEALRDNASMSAEILLLESDILALENEKKSLAAEYNTTVNNMKAEYESTITDMQNEYDATISSLRADISNNNALYRIFNGIGDGISGIINTFAGFSVGGVSLGTVFAFVGIVIFVIIVLKFVRR